MTDEETIDELFTRYDQVAGKTEAKVKEIGDLGYSVPADEAPWERRPHLETVSVRWVLLYLIQETARHAGHAGIIRESISSAAVPSNRG